MKKVQFKLFIISTIILILVILFFTYGVQKDKENTSGIIGEGLAGCQQAGGQWSAEFRECLGIDALTCEKIGGTFNECASACRNDPKAEICTMQCLQVCEVQ